MPGFFDEDALIDPDAPQSALRCTPDALLDYLRRSVAISNRMPTMQELKAEFGVRLGVFMAAWELQARGDLTRDWKLSRK